MDYQKLSFKCGLEIHQQLSGKKLFCDCPTITNKTEAPDFTIKRTLNITAGESGKKDVAAEFEQEKNKTFVYEAYKDCNCLVELDEEPPHRINQEALQTALEVSLLLNAQIVDEIQVMRKIVIDGSNVSGFQRTALIAINGYIETSKGKVKVPTICLEEEAAKKIESKGNEVVYRLDRLGIPLLEIATAPDVKDPEHAKETASLIGMILRSTGKMKRGLGTIRQDINLSINNQPRIELKGFQDLRSIPKTVEKEIERALKNPKKEGEVRKVNPDFSSSYLRPLPGSARMYPETDVPKIQITLQQLKSIKLPELTTNKVKTLETEYKLPKYLAEEIIQEEIDFEEYTKKYASLQPLTIAKVLIEIPKEMKSRLKLDVEKLTPQEYEKVLDALNKNKINEEAVIPLFQEQIEKGTMNFEHYKKADSLALESEIKQLVEKHKGLSLNALMGMLMAKYRGKIEGKTVIQLIQKYKK